ncbi:MAG TPA: thioredoxin family protein [Firmicutes bacterium]|nr:thioredoxin family protein [Bacillota bacterium]
MDRIDTQERANGLVAAHDMALLYFGSQTCGVCRDMLPKVEKLLADYPNIKGAYVEADSVPELAAAFSVFTLPALLVYAEGKEVIREARHISLVDVTERVDRYYGLLFD